MLKMLSEYSEQLNRVAEVVYELKLEVQWTRIIRFSTTSNFALITGIGVVRKGQAIGDSVLKEDYELPISMTLLLEMLDDGSTPYQIADAAQLIANVRQVLGPEEFHMFLKDERSDMEKIQALLPKLDTAEEREAIHEQIKSGEARPPLTITTPEMLPGRLSGFDTEGLTDEQQQSFKLSYTAKRNKVN
jgi:hypothetical protein